MTKAVRVTVISEQDDFKPFNFDLVVGNDERAEGNDWRFGFSSDEEGGLCPFILKRAKRHNGYEIDFGAGYYAEDEYWETDIYDIKIEIGAAVTIWDNNRKVYYGKIKQVNQLAP
jgi:hypothetical protein